MLRMNDDLTHFSVPLDDESVRRLMILAEETKVPPVILLASLLHDVLRDDADTNCVAAAEVASKLKAQANRLN